MELASEFYLWLEQVSAVAGRTGLLTVVALDGCAGAVFLLVGRTTVRLEKMVYESFGELNSMIG